MIWNTQLIDELLNRYQEDKDIKSLVRDITINHILSDDDESVVFPFLIDPVTTELNLRAPNLSFDYTTDEISKLFEIKSDTTSIFNHLKIFNKLYEFKRKWLEDYKSNRYNIFITSRQIGSSYMAMMCALHYILTNTDKNVIFIGINKQMLIETSMKFSKLYNSLPFFMKVGVIHTTDNPKKYEIKFDNGCKIKFIDGSSNIAEQIDFLIIDDLDRMQSQLMHHLFPMLSARSHSKLLIFGQNQKQNTWLQTAINNPYFNVQYYNWTSISDRSTEWVKETINIVGGINQFINEYNCGQIDSNLQAILRDFKIDDILEKK